MTLTKEKEDILKDIWEYKDQPNKKIDWKNEISYLLSLLLRIILFVVVFLLLVWVASAAPVLALILSFLFLLGTGLKDYL